MRKYLLLVLLGLLLPSECFAIAVGCQYRVFNYSGAAHTYCTGPNDITFAGCTLAGTVNGTGCASYYFNTANRLYTCTETGWVYTSGGSGNDDTTAYNGQINKVNSQFISDAYNIENYLPACEFTPPVADCSALLATATASCGGSSFIQTFDDLECSGYTCKDCLDPVVTDYLAAQCPPPGSQTENCTSSPGYQSLSLSVDCLTCNEQQLAYYNDHCLAGDTLVNYECSTNQGVCAHPTCKDFSNDCFASCPDGFSAFDCQNNASGYPVVSVPCKCLDGSLPDATDGIVPLNTENLLQNIYDTSKYQLNAVGDLHATNQGIAASALQTADSAKATKENTATANIELAQIKSGIAAGNLTAVAGNALLGDIKTSSASTAAHTNSIAASNATIASDTGGMLSALDDLKTKAQKIYDDNVLSATELDNALAQIPADRDSLLTTLSGVFTTDKDARAVVMSDLVNEYADEQKYRPELVTNNPLVNTYGQNLVKGIIPLNSVASQNITFEIGTVIASRGVESITIPAATLSTTKTFLAYGFSILTLLGCMQILLNGFKPTK